VQSRGCPLAPAADLADVSSSVGYGSVGSPRAFAGDQRVLPDPCVNLAIKARGRSGVRRTTGARCTCWPAPARGRHEVSSRRFLGICPRACAGTQRRTPPPSEVVGSTRTASSELPEQRHPVLIEVVNTSYAPTDRPRFPSVRSSSRSWSAMRAARRGPSVRGGLELRDVTAHASAPVRGARRSRAQTGAAALRHQDATDRLAANGARGRRRARAAGRRARYSTKPHFIHDFRSDGKLPSTLIGHVSLERARGGAQPVRGLIHPAGHQQPCHRAAGAISGAG